MLARALQHWAAVCLLLFLFLAHSTYVILRNDASLLGARSTISAGRVWTVVLDANGSVLHRGFEEPLYDFFEHAVVELYVSSGRWTSGWWAATRRNVGIVAIVRTYPFEWWDDEIMVRETSLLLEEWRQPLTPQELLALRPNGRIDRTSIIWSGYLHNAIALLFAALFALACLMHTHGRVRSWVWQRRLNNGRCPLCAYDLRGSANHSCSECSWRRESDPKNK